MHIYIHYMVNIDCISRILKESTFPYGPVVLGPAGGAPCGVEVCLLHEDPETPEGPKVPAGVAVEQVVFVIHREVAATAVWWWKYRIDSIIGSIQYTGLTLMA